MYLCKIKKKLRQETIMSKFQFKKRKKNRRKRSDKNIPKYLQLLPLGFFPLFSRSFIMCHLNLHHLSKCSISFQALERGLPGRGMRYHIPVLASLRSFHVARASVSSFRQETATFSESR